MDDERPLDLRDRIALEILNGIIANSKDNNDTTKDIVHYLSYSNEYDDAEAKKTQHYAEQRMEKIVRNCYKVADIVRRVRLTVFE